MVSVNESVGWSRKCSSLSKYSSLRCHLQQLSSLTNDYRWITDQASTSLTGACIKNIYQVHRSIEEAHMTEQKIDNKRLLFHASQPQNFVGILSRGLLLPKIVVDDLGGSRTDVGMLGSGLYFSDSMKTSAKYSSQSKHKGTRLMLVCQVALGRCLDVTEYHTELTAPPEGYDSVHGVRGQEGVESQFKDDEFTVYSLSQQRLVYLIEFTLPGDVLQDCPAYQSKVEGHHVIEDVTDLTLSSVELSDVENITDPLSSVKSGLMSSSDSPVPLKSVHIRATLIDLASQVVVLQSYTNNNDTSIEAKYVFPLDDQAAVCGFEAFINGKHVVGEVKEKETAHREYKEAISQGHGAYLMDQDKETPDVFTVSVGNLPPHCSVLIRITYVAELEVEGEKVVFRLPSSVAPWKRNAALDTTTQSDMETVKVGSDVSVDVSVHVSVEMPFDIRCIESPSHRIRSKNTATKAVVEILKDQALDSGFTLWISLAEIHVPRMWVEQHPDKDSRACMMTFYPEFESETSKSYEVVMLLDMSNSMQGSALMDAKKVLLLALHHLPDTCTFNIVLFGTDYTELFTASKPKTKDNTNQAVKFIKNAVRCMGSTELFSPLHSFFLLSPEQSERNVLLVSDGHVSNEDVLLHSVQHNATHTRLFTMGVGPVANRHTLRSLGRAGGGASEFFDPKLKSKWEGKVKGQLWKMSQPGVSCVSVEWQDFNRKKEIIQAPAQIMGLFSGCRQVVYGFVSNCTQATLNAMIDNQSVSTMVSTHELGVTRGKILHQLAAKAVIKDWHMACWLIERLNMSCLRRTERTI